MLILTLIPPEGNWGCYLNKGNPDVLIVSETKLDDTFPIDQTTLEDSNTPFRIDRNTNGGGILLFILVDIAAKLNSTENPPIESFF